MHQLPNLFGYQLQTVQSLQNTIQLKIQRYLTKLPSCQTAAETFVHQNEHQNFDKNLHILPSIAKKHSFFRLDLALNTR